MLVNKGEQTPSQLMLPSLKGVALPLNGIQHQEFQNLYFVQALPRILQLAIKDDKKSSTTNMYRNYQKAKSISAGRKLTPIKTMSEDWYI